MNTFLVLIAITFCTVNGEFASIWSSGDDSVAVQTVEGSERPCLEGKAFSIPDEGEGDYLKITPNKWHSGTIRFGKIATGYFCKMGDGQRPNLGIYGYLSFQAKTYNFDSTQGCEPRVDFYGGSYPRKTSNSIIMKGDYVDKGDLVDYEYRTVVIPVADLITADFPLDQIQKLTFRNCAGLSGQRYDLQNIMMTDTPPAISAGGEDIAPPTTSPTLNPTPTNPDLFVYESVQDGYSAEGQLSCLFFEDRDITGQVSDVEDYLIVRPDAWRSGGLQFGCLATDSDGTCTHTCFQDGDYPNFSPYEALVFAAKLDNGDSLVEDCKPKIKLYGGGSPAKESNSVSLEGEYVDEGYLVADEWRQVVIPLHDLKTTWDLNGVKTMRFLSCGTEVSTQPIYKIKDIKFSDSPPSVRSMAPSPFPTIRVTEHPSMATHFYYYNGWYPVVDKSSGTWLSADNNAWPNIPDSADDYEFSVAIPAGSHVIYSGIITNAKLNQVVIEASGTLEISANADIHTSLILSTLRVEEGGTLKIHTSEPTSIIDIQFDGEINSEADPTELLNGLVSFGGTVLIEGNAKCSIMEEIRLMASAGSSTIVLNGNTVANCWSVGDEIALPDTQTGLDSGHYDFIPTIFNSLTDSQYESVVILQLEVVGDTTVLTLDKELSFDHRAGAHVGLLSRSITLRTSDSSSVRGHILHTGIGAFDVKNTRIQDMGRATVEPFSSTTIEIDNNVQLADGLAKMIVTSWGTNQVARYGLHAHHSLVPMEFSGNAIVGGLRFGIVAHNSRVAVNNNVVVEVEGSGILLEWGTETGDVKGNYIIGTGGGSGESDSARFTPSQGTEFGHGGFAIWSRTAYSAIENNVAEGIFGEAPYAFFLHLNFMDTRIVPPVDGTPTEIIGKTRGEVQYDVNNGILSIDTYGSFQGNRCLGSYKRAFQGNYFLLAPPQPQGHLLQDFVAVSLGASGAGFSFGHSSRFTITGSLTAVTPGNTIVGVAVANGNLILRDCDYLFNGVQSIQGGCLECLTEINC